MKAFTPIMLFVCSLLFVQNGFAQSHPEELYEKGKDYLRQNKYEQALEYFSRAIVKRWGIPKYFSNRGITYQKIGVRDNNEDALRRSLKDFDRALRYHQSRDYEMMARYHNSRGNSYYFLQEYKYALSDYLKAKDLDSNNPVYFSNAALSFAKTGEMDRAQQMVDRAISLAPSEPIPYFTQARIYALDRQGDQAMNSFEQALNKGFHNKRLLQNHINDLAIISNSSRFHELLQEHDLDFDYEQMDVRYESPVSRDNTAIVSGNSPTPMMEEEDDEIVTELPPILKIEDITFSEKVLDAEETARLSVTVRNMGAGDAKNVYVALSSYLDGLDYPETTPFPVIAKNGGTATVEIDITGETDLSTSEANLLLEVVEPEFKVKIRGKQLRIPTRELRKPELILAKFGVLENLSANPNNQIDINEQIDVKFAVQNVGQGNADNVEIIVENNQPGVMLLGVVEADGRLLRKTPNFSTIAPGKYATIVYRYFVNSEFTSSTLQFTLKANERHQKYGFSDFKNVAINSELKEEGYIRQIQNIDDDAPAQEIIIEDVPDFVVDVHRNIPESSYKKENAFALIIGNEDYTKFQTDLDSESNVKYARTDAQVFATYCEKTLGLPKDNITVVTDAISSTMKREIKRLANKAKYSNEEVELIFYYSGHGSPHPQSKESYLMPVDVRGSEVQDGIKLDELYADLTEYPSDRVTVFLDACFSGGGRESGLDPAKGVKIRPKKSSLDGNLVVFSSSSGTQESLFYREKQHGIFTYFLLKKLQESRGNLSYGELAEYLSRMVPLTSTDINYKEQNPEVNASPKVTDRWENWEFR